MVDSNGPNFNHESRKSLEELKDSMGELARRGAFLVAGEVLEKFAHIIETSEALVGDGTPEELRIASETVARIAVEARQAAAIRSMADNPGLSFDEEADERLDDDGGPTTETG